MDAAEDLMEQWGLVPDGPADGRATPVRTHDGRRAVLKVAAPTGWRTGAIPALKAWRAEGAVEVLRAKPAAGAVLLEPLQTSGLWGADELSAIAGLWRTLHRPAPASVPTIADVLSPVLDELEAAGRDPGLPPRLARQAVETGRRLLGSPGRPVLVHGALHGDHVMLRRGDPVAISPLGFAGDAECELAASLDVVHGGVPEMQDHFWGLLDELVAAGVVVDEARLRDWTLVLSVVRARASDDPGRVTHLLTAAKAVSALQVGQDWE